MLPSDIVGTLLEHLFHRGLRSIVVSYSTQHSGLRSRLSWSASGGCVCWSSPPSEAIAGASALLFGTTFLHYTQNMMENNLIFLLTLTGLCFQYELALHRKHQVARYRLSSSRSQSAGPVDHGNGCYRCGFFRTPRDVVEAGSARARGADLHLELRAGCWALLRSLLGDR